MLGQFAISWNLSSRVNMKFEAHEGEVMSARWDSTGRYCATSGADRKIKIWEVRSYLRSITMELLQMSQRATPELRATLVGSNAAVMGIDFDSAGTMILGSSNDFATRVWTVEDSRLGVLNNKVWFDSEVSISRCPDYIS